MNASENQMHNRATSLISRQDANGKNNIASFGIKEKRVTNPS